MEWDGETLQTIAMIYYLQVSSPGRLHNYLEIARSSQLSSDW
jgi:hypothetical protein